MGLGTLHAGLLLMLLLLLCLARGSLQGGVKPQANGALGRLYLPSLIRGEGGVHPGAGLGPAGAKAGPYTGYGPQGLQPGPAGTQNGFGVAPGVRVKPGKAGYGVPAGYGAGLGGYPQGAKQKPGYFHAALPLGGFGAGPRAGSYPTAQQGYPGVGGGYLVNGAQPGYGNGYSAGGNSHPGAGVQSGYGNGAQAAYLGRFAGPSTDLSAAKFGLGQLPYNGQPQQAMPTGLGGDYSAGKYGGMGQLMYGAQLAGPSALDGNGNGPGYTNGGDLQANGLAAGAYGPLTAGQAPGGYGLTPTAYGGKEAKYGLNGFLGNGYRGRCPSGKC
ncbi:glycine-rich extracellular protein 1 isoform X1 [Chrysemys picta bellii]|uniref:glycine-rich extracellular protein 1 isoform X1 n=1 Tax=Chrysemys picta bellii TaxID=8478 RepID=UPI001C6795C4|nr:glycine-rich cell wall structural protein 1.8-like isoform X1 [Chrysemys picta bellii]